MRAFLKKWLGPELYELLKKEWRYRRLRKSGRFARFGIDEILERLLPHNNGFYVELGANDGALASNSYYFELKKNWRGVLIEPAPNLFLSCLKRRGEKNHVFCAACVPDDYPKDLVRMQYADSMTISPGLDLDIGDHDDFLQRGTKFLQKGERIFEFGAPSATLTELLIAASAPSLIDFLSLDVEGAELAVLRGVNFAEFNFKYIVIESRDIGRVLAYLEPHGYRLLKKVSHHDYLLELTSAKSPDFSLHHSHL